MKEVIVIHIYLIYFYKVYIYIYIVCVRGCMWVRACVWTCVRMCSAKLQTTKSMTVMKSIILTSYYKLFFGLNKKQNTLKYKPFYSQPARLCHKILIFFFLIITPFTAFRRREVFVQSFLEFKLSVRALCFFVALKSHCFITRKVI